MVKQYTRIKADYRQANRKLQNTILKSLKGADGTMEQLADLGKYHAKTIAPHYTGKTASLIKTFKGQTSRGPYAEVVAQNSVAGDGHRRNMTNFNLVRWMHTSPNAADHIRSGSRKFMYRTTEWLRRKGIEVARGHFNRINFNI